MTKKNYLLAESILKQSNWKNKALALLHITVNGLVLGGDKKRKPSINTKQN